jgi:hypothetical protein
MTLKEFVKRILRTPLAYEVAAREVEEAKVDLLEALSHLDYARAVVEYQHCRVRRLDLYLLEGEEPK